MSLFKSSQVKSSQVKSSLSLFGLHFVNKLHLGSSLHSPSVDSLQEVKSVSGNRFKGVIWCFLKIIILCIWCNRICWHALMSKTHYFSNTVHYCRSSMPRLSQTRRFLQSPSFRQAQSALIGQLAQCIVIGRTPQALRNVTPLSIIASFSFQNKWKDS